MRKLILLACLTLFSTSVFAVSMNFSGHFRSDAASYSRLGLGLPNTNTKNFIGARALLNPNVVIDDHFSLKSQWSLLTSPNFTPNATQALGTGQGGFIFGDTNTSYMVLSRAWVEWTSDFGVMRVGRMPVSWGYGLLYDAGNSVWDDFQTTMDRIEYRLHLGHVVGAVAYSKLNKNSVLGNQNDQEFYSAYLQYDNPELEVEGGIMYEKQSRSSAQTPINQYALPQSATNPTLQADNTTPLPWLATGSAPYPLSNNVVDVYLKKSMGYFTLGGELSWINGTARDPITGAIDSLNALGFLGSASYEYHSVKAFLEVLYASGDNNLSAGHQNGFVLLHRNRRPGLILGRELLGAFHGNTVAQGSCVYYGNPGSFSGCLYFRPGIRVDWSPTWASGLELIVARKAATQPNEPGNLGVEVDGGTEYSPYKNFDLGINLGYLFPGAGLGVPNPQGVFAVRTTGSVKF